jgi:hypothetical protein
MKNNKKIIEQERKAYQKEIAKFEKMLNDATNDIELIAVYNHMIDLLSREIEKWNVEIQKSQKENIKESDERIDVILSEVKGLMDLMDIISKERKSRIPNAIVLYKARQNSHLETEPTRFVTYDVGLENENI